MTDPLKKFIAIDLETTGLNPQEDKIIEIGAIEFKNGKIANTYGTLINPQTAISDFIENLTGITNEKVQTAPIIENIFDDFLEFIGTTPLIFHNAYFDISFLKEQNDFQDIYDKDNVLDTLLLARAANPYRNSYKLEDLAKTYNIITETKHRAEEDAKTTGLLYLQLAEDFKKFPEQTLIDLQMISSYRKSPYLNFFQKINKIKREDEICDNLPENPHRSHLLEKEKKTDKYSELNIENFYHNEGYIASHLENYECRPSQKILTETIITAFREEKHALIEAGTGTGKSFAYIIPSLIFNSETKEKILISTKTKNLQDQLFFKDIPFIHKITGKRFSSVLLKGKSNYLCARKYHQAREYGIIQAPDYLRGHLLPVAIFHQTTLTGDLSEISKADPKNRIAKSFAADRLTCHPSSCPNRKHCKWFTTRQEAKKADIIVTNHALFFADIITPNSIFSGINRIIIDEAHHIEQIATSYFGSDYSFIEIKHLLESVFKEKKKQPNLLSKIIQSKSTLLNENDIDKLIERNNIIKKHYLQFIKILEALYHSLMEHAIDKATKNYNIIRKRVPKEGYLNNLILGLLDKLESNWKFLNNELHDFLKTINEIDDNKTMEIEFLSEIKIQIEEIVNFLKYFINNQGENSVHWYELDNKRQDLRLYTWPLNLQPYFKDYLIDNMKSAIFISATLSINNNFKYFKGKIGSPPEEQSEIFLENIIPSGFPLEEQIKFILPGFLPDPSSNQFIKKAAELFIDLFKQKAIGSLFLFTSYQMMKEFYEIISIIENTNKIPLFTQQKGSGNKQIIEDFKKIKHSILLGTDSFWEGFDVPGESLELLAIVKLPFQVPDEPIIEARLEFLSSQNKNPFYYYTIPEAIIKFKQGFGRLIRHNNDKGSIIILDKRIYYSKYGKFFQNSVSVPLITAQTLKEFYELI